MCVPNSNAGVRRKGLGCVGRLSALDAHPAGRPSGTSQWLGLEASRSQGRAERRGAHPHEGVATGKTRSRQKQDDVGANDTQPWRPPKDLHLNHGICVTMSA